MEYNYEKKYKKTLGYHKKKPHLFTTKQSSLSTHRVLTQSFLHKQFTSPELPLLSNHKIPKVPPQSLSHSTIMPATSNNVIGVFF